MGFLIGLLTFVLVVDCVILIFLILIQLPKKEAGAGLAFGGSASDALFGAGSGNVLTKITKYTAGIFFVLAVMLAVLYRSAHGSGTAAFTSGLSATQPAPVSSQSMLPPAPAPGGPTMTLPTLTNLPGATNQSGQPAVEEPTPRPAATNVALPPMPLLPPTTNAPAK